MNPLNLFSIFLIKGYRYLISPLLGPRCRFSPSCSLYSLHCFQKFSFFQALWYSGVRLSKCHPFHPGGEDPIPQPGIRKGLLFERDPRQ